MLLKESPHEKLKKEYKQKDKEENTFFWWLIFIIGFAALCVVAVVFSD